MAGSVEIVSKSVSRGELLVPLGFEYVHRSSVRETGSEDWQNPIMPAIVAYEKLAAAVAAGETNGGAKAAFVTKVLERSSTGEVVGVLPITGEVGEIAENMIEMNKRGGKPVLVSAMALMDESGNISQESRSINLPLRQDLRVEEVAKFLFDGGHKQTNVNVQFQNGHGSLLSLDDLSSVEKSRLMMSVSGVMPEQLERLLAFGRERDGLSVMDLINIDPKIISDLKDRVLPGFFERIALWDRKRPIKSPRDQMDAAGKSLRSFGFAFNESTELFIESRVEYSKEEKVKVLQKEAADVIVFLIQTMNYARKFSTDKAIDMLKQDGEWIGLDLATLGEWSGLVSQSSSAVEAIMLTLLRGQQRWVYATTWPDHDEPNMVASMSQGMDLIFRYFVAKGWDIEDVLSRTLTTNEKNYPRYMYDPKISPIASEEKITALVRLMRKAKVSKNVTALNLYHQRFPGDFLGIDPENTAKTKQEILEWTKTILSMIVVGCDNQKYREHAVVFLNDLE